jgi:hypothetical protein
MMPFKIVRPASVMAAALTLVALGAAVHAGTINSNLQIDPGQTFELGGGQEGGFVVTGTNTGPVAVVVLSKADGTAAVERGTVAPGGAVDAQIAPGEMALLRNTSSQKTARLKLKVTGDTSSLGMGYADNP